MVDRTAVLPGVTATGGEVFLHNGSARPGGVKAAGTEVHAFDPQSQSVGERVTGQDGVRLTEKRLSSPAYSVAIVNDEILSSVRTQSGGTFYDYEMKYLSDGTQYFSYSRLIEQNMRELQAFILRAWQTPGHGVRDNVYPMPGRDGQVLPVGAEHFSTDGKPRCGVDGGSSGRDTLSTTGDTSIATGGRVCRRPH